MKNALKLLVCALLVIVTVMGCVACEKNDPEPNQTESDQPQSNDAVLGFHEYVNGEYEVYVNEEYRAEITNLEIPSTYNGKPVTRIKDYGFSSCSKLLTVTIPDSITSIMSGAFWGCTSLTSVTIPDRVTSIGWCAFYECTNLTSVTIPDSVTSIDEKAFDLCESLTSVYITDIKAWCRISFGSFASNPLHYAEALYLNGDVVEELVIPEDITSIGDFAFYGCTSFTSVTISDGAKSIGKGAFRNCTNLTSITIPDSVTTIGEDAFWDCTNLTSIEIPNHVTNIGRNTFYNCKKLTSVTIPESVTKIDLDAFYECTSLERVYATDTWYHIDFASKASNPLWNRADMYLDGKPVTAVTFPDGTRKIEDYLFSGCTSITSVIIPKSVSGIGKASFEACTSLTDIYYAGTTEEWNAITVHDGYMIGNGNYTVHCTNGEIVNP